MSMEPIKGTEDMWTGDCQFETVAYHAEKKGVNWKRIYPDAAEKEGLKPYTKSERKKFYQKLKKSKKLKKDLNTCWTESELERDMTNLEYDYAIRVYLDYNQEKVRQKMIEKEQGKKGPSTKHSPISVKRSSINLTQQKEKPRFPDFWGIRKR